MKTKTTMNRNRLIPFNTFPNFT